ncbi:hypothetical protein PILCRDRAFT_11258 [Piloderma croceum F 1598]|uniref:Uncharacterized protein n=1 Tax=Piloderma croceum (strain F 1598) TaxID=765440 RepID=A0A0C3F0E7_PILCF|nr:hypothetical protein PILCRDRAFT_11258 [Piloderma croceum F 1598]
MRSYCYGSDSDSDNDDYVPKAKQHTATRPIIPSPTQTQPPSEPNPHEYKCENGDTDATEYGYNADRENEETKGDRQTDGSGYKHEGLAHEGDETHERERLKCVTGGAYKPEELGYKLQHDHNETNRYVHPDHNLSPTPSATHDDCDPPTSHTSHPTPTNTPTPLPPPPPPQHPTHAHVTSPASNQQGHVTALKNDQRDERKLAPTNGGSPKPHIKYPRCTGCHPPLSWLAISNETAVPNCIEDSQPLFLQQKHRYRKRYAECKPIPIPPIPTLPIPHTPAPFATHLDAGSTLAEAQAPAPPFATSKSGSKSTDHSNNNNNLIPYSTIQFRPPPWPIKHPNQSQHQHNNKDISARITTAQRPPPWPNKNGTVPISFTSSHLPHWPNHTIYQPTTSTPPARPPPWPILPPNTLQNYRNARRRLRKKSQILFYFSSFFS